VTYQYSSGLAKRYELASSASNSPSSASSEHSQTWFSGLPNEVIDATWWRKIDLNLSVRIHIRIHDENLRRVRA
jgi:hypothetical protein